MVLLIGILSGLAYSSFSDLIFSNRARETAQTIRTFAERALADAKRRNTIVVLELSETNIIANIDGQQISQPLGGFSADTQFGSPIDLTGGDAAETEDEVEPWENEVTSVRSIGTSGITMPGYFSACGVRGYCGAAVKTKNNNSFKAYVKRGNSANWEEL